MLHVIWGAVLIMLGLLVGLTLLFILVMVVLALLGATRFFWKEWRNGSESDS